MMEEVLSAYIHIPFCLSICSYCDFCKMFYSKDMVEKYLDALEVEIKAKYKKEKLNTLYIGGGTPSCLTSCELTKLFTILKELKINSDNEFTVEANINDITEEKMMLFKENDINRLSIGIETTNPKHLKFLKRNHTKEEILEKVKIAKKYFSNINIDLMYAFPNETLKDLEEDLQFITDLNPNHISIYSLIIEEHTELYIKGITPINEDKDYEMYKFIIEYLKNKGYEHYEISNFAKKGYYSKHNLTYWNNEHYYGFGLGASGYIGNIRYSNTKSINNYLKNNYDYLKESITKNVAMENEMIFGLRKIKGISKQLFFEKYGFNIEQIFDIIDLLDKNLLMESSEYLFIPEDKLYISNSILITFIGGSNGKY